MSPGTGYFSEPSIVTQDSSNSYCFGASYKAVWDASRITTSTDQFTAVIGSYIQIDDEFMQVKSVDPQNLFVLTVSRGQLGTEPNDHFAGSVFP